jgi:predicted KAP-like P-loop ATPase
LPFIGKWAERAAGGAKFLGSWFKRKGGALPTSVTSQRREIAKMLEGSGKRLLVVIDDIDRLPKADIRELFKLVRLTADFPNTTYLLAFDRPRVEDALGETEGEGRAYLEKILQVTFDVPRIREPDLATFLLGEIQRAVGDLKHGPFDQAEWTNIFTLAVRPLFRTPRDVRRYTNSIPVALSVVGDEIAVADLLAIEAMRSLVLMFGR